MNWYPSEICPTITNLRVYADNHMLLSEEGPFHLFGDGESILLKRVGSQADMKKSHLPGNSR
jgi:hypothetical protein